MAQHNNNNNNNNSSSSSPSSPLLFKNPQRAWIDNRCVPTCHDIVFNEESNNKSNNSNSIGRIFYQQLLDEYYDEYFDAKTTTTTTTATTTTTTSTATSRASTISSPTDKQRNSNTSSLSSYNATFAGGTKTISYTACSIPNDERSRIRQKIFNRFKKESGSGGGGGKFIEQHKSLSDTSSGSPKKGSPKKGSSCCYYYKKIYTKQRVHDKIDESFNIMRQDRGDGNASVVPAATAIAATVPPPIQAVVTVAAVAVAARTTTTTTTALPIYPHQQQWTKHEHGAFIRAIHHYGTSNWKVISNFVASRNEKQTKDYGYFSFMGGTNDESSRTMINNNMNNLNMNMNMNMNNMYMTHWTIDDYDLLLEKAPYNWKYINIGWNKDIVRIKLIQKKERQKVANNKLKANRKLSPIKKNKATTTSTAMVTNNNVAAALAATATATRQQQQHLYHPYQQQQRQRQQQQQQFHPQQLLYQQMFQQYHPHSQQPQLPQQLQQQQQQFHNTNGFLLNNNEGYTNNNICNNLSIQNNPPPPPNLAPPPPPPPPPPPHQHQEVQDIISISSGDDDDDHNNDQQHQEVQQDIIEIVDSSDDDDDDDDDKGNDNDNDNHNDIGNDNNENDDGDDDEHNSEKNKPSMKERRIFYRGSTGGTWRWVERSLESSDDDEMTVNSTNLKPAATTSSPDDGRKSPDVDHTDDDESSNDNDDDDEMTVNSTSLKPAAEKSSPDDGRKSPDVDHADDGDDNTLDGGDDDAIARNHDVSLDRYPSKWDPTHPKIAKVLSIYEEKFITEFPDGLSPGIADSPSKSIKAVKKYCARHPEWEQSYPVIMAVAVNDVIRLKYLINLDVESIHKKMDMDGTASGPGDWASYLGRLHCLIVLLKAGLNPWEGRVWVDTAIENIIPLLELKADLEPVNLEAYSPSAALTTENDDGAISSSTNDDGKSNNLLKIHHLLQPMLTSAAKTTAAADLDPMLYEIGNSPYEGNRCAETGENDLDELKKLMEPVVVGGTGPPKMNRKLEPLFGDTLADANIKARIEIAKESNTLFDSSWKEGKIGNADLGWIPSRQLLLCLQEEKFGDTKFGTQSTIQTIVRELDCFELTMEALKFWNLRYVFPILASNKNEEAFWFKDKSQRLNCWKCQIFVARTYATLQILKRNKKSDKIKPSLMRKIKAYLGIMNDHVNSNVAEYKRLLEKKDEKSQKKLRAKMRTATTTATTMKKKKPVGAKSKKKGQEPTKKVAQVKPKKKFQKMAGRKTTGLDDEDGEQSIIDFSIRSRSNNAKRKIGIKNSSPHKKSTRVMKHKLKQPPPSSSRKNNIITTTTTATTAPSSSQARKRKRIDIKTVASTNKNKKNVKGNNATTVANTIRRTAAAAAAAVVVVHPAATAARSSHPPSSKPEPSSHPELESEPARRYKNVIDGTCEERESILITGFSIIEKQVSQMNKMMDFFEQQLQPDNQYIFKQEIRDNVLDERREREQEQLRKVCNSTKNKNNKKRKKGI